MPNQRRYWSCERKQYFSHLALAKEALYRFWHQHGKQNHRSMTAYHCPFCGGYHIGHAIKRKEENNDTNNPPQEGVAD